MVTRRCQTQTAARHVRGLALGTTLFGDIAVDEQWSKELSAA